MSWLRRVVAWVLGLLRLVKRKHGRLLTEDGRVYTDQDGNRIRLE